MPTVHVRRDNLYGNIGDSCLKSTLKDPQSPSSYLYGGSISTGFMEFPNVTASTLRKKKGGRRKVFKFREKRGTPQGKKGDAARFLSF